MSCDNLSFSLNILQFRLNLGLSVDGTQVGGSAQVNSAVKTIPKLGCFILVLFKSSVSNNKSCPEARDFLPFSGR